MARHCHGALLDERERPPRGGERYFGVDIRMNGMRQHGSRPVTDRRLSAAFERHKEGDLAWAAGEYRQVLAQEPNHPTALHYLGLVAQQTGHTAEAIELLQRSIELDPTDPRACNHLGLVLLASNRIEQAFRCFEAALYTDPACTDALQNLANLLKKGGELERAIALYRRAVELEPLSARSLYNLANALRDNREYEEALSSFERVIEIEPDNFRAHHNLAVLLEEIGHFDEAVEHYRIVLRIQPRHAKALANLLCIPAYHADAEIVAAAESRLADLATHDDCPDSGSDDRMGKRTDARTDDRIKLHHALGRHFDRAGRHAGAFAHFASANVLIRRSSPPFRVSAVAEYFDRIMGTFDAAYFADSGHPGSSSERPVFIVGMPRSGTTLAEQILGSHPDVFAAGELHQVPALVRDLQPDYPEVMPHLDERMIKALAQRYLEALAGRAGMSASRVTDKLPINFTHIGLIATLFPHARIIHCRRDPLDVGLSCFTQIFDIDGDYTTDLRNIGEYILQYERLMAHWRQVLPQGMYELRYEDMVRDQQASSRALLAYCGLEWDAACLDFQAVDRPVLTPSRWQVRQPVYASSVGRWKNYAAHLEPLREVLQGGGAIQQY